MKKLSLSLFAAALLVACNNTEEKKDIPVVDTTKKDTATVAEAPKGYDTIEVYHFKGNEPYINEEFLKTASESEKALLGYYCYFFSSNCKDSKHCDLTKALGYGDQNSKDHKTAVNKWFADDETKQLVKEGGRVTPTGAKNMSWYEEIKLVKKGELTVVRYLSAWKTDKMEGKGRGTDEYQITTDKIKVIGRSHEEI